MLFFVLFSYIKKTDYMGYRIFLSGTCLIFLHSIAFGQISDTLKVNSNVVVNYLTEKLTNELNLQKEQIEDVQIILAERSQKIVTRVPKANSHEEKRSIVMLINKNTLEKLKLVLSEEQLEKYNSLKTDLKEQKKAFPQNYLTDEDYELDF